MKKIKKGLSILLTVIMIISALPLTAFNVFALTSGDYDYQVLDDGTAEITKYNGSDAELTILSEIDGYTVTSIGGEAFKNCTSLTGVTIPNSVTNIGGSAFYGCIALTDVYYSSDASQWNTITIGSSNGCLTNSTTTTIHFNSFSGDINDDGVIDENDYAMATAYVMCQAPLTYEQKIFADVNRDGVVDTFDAIKIDLCVSMI